jgi:hypothetical protein
LGQYEQALLACQQHTLIGVALATAASGDTVGTVRLGVAHL